MKKIILLSVITISLNLVFAQNTTIDGGEFTGNVRWSGRILIRGDVTIASSCRLVIDPGTRVLFEPNTDMQKGGLDKTRSELIVRGVLIARGRAGEKIVFSSAAESPRMADWHGVEFIQVKSQSILEYCIVEYAHSGIIIKNSQIQVSSSEIRYNFHAGIEVKVKANPKIIQNIISENGYAGVVCELGASPILTDNLITQNPIGLVAFSMAQPNLGSLANDQNYNPGRNRILGNEEYDVYNHSSKQIFAENNFWESTRTNEIAAKIYDRNDDAKYGNIDFEPLFRDRNLGGLLLLTQNQETPAASKVEETQAASVQEPIRNQVPTQNKTTPEQQKNTPTEQVAKVTTPPKQTESKKADTPVVEKKEEQPPVVASTEPKEIPASNLSVESEEIKNQIDYNQVFMEAFLDGGKKKYINKPKFRINPVVRSSMQSGQIFIKVIVKKDGAVESASILRGLNDVLDNAALESVKEFKYETGLLNGNPVRFTTTELFRFQ